MSDNFEAYFKNYRQDELKTEELGAYTVLKKSNPKLLNKVQSTIN